MTTTAALLTSLRAGLAELADPAKAPDMQRYMKSEMPFRGVSAPQRRALGRRVFVEQPLSTEDSWRSATLMLWREAVFREERYLAVDLTGVARYRKWQTPRMLPVYEEMVVTGAWWDLVDEVASGRIGPLLREHREELTPVVRGWATDDHLWKRRTSIICQLGAKEDTDTELLTACIEANADDSDFFIRKGIGWALRQFARTEPGWVRAFVDTHPGLSPLSRREALKHL
ncbi:DNA alkylation repair protein [Actinophytocola xanthii]|uniref:DNA alkylation repair protein n=1 Tax=Actinophytocola xanthii TaxID=1912961 RepID=A0A1Q8C6A1_9PSEU|nr:DNA alkylation repair protein [Actinophytocola xanthii]OLF09894.1 DNA alkylation repair protein [Actinophytocola xanthii]